MKTLWKALLWITVALVALLLNFYFEENVRGRRLWDAHLRDLAARGDSLDIRQYVPPPVPDDQNMAAAPIFAELFATNRMTKSSLKQLRMPYTNKSEGSGWLGAEKADLTVWQVAFSNDNLLAALAVYDPMLQAVEAASHRPKARFNTDYEAGYKMNLPHIAVLLKLGKLLRVKAMAELAAGQTDAACRDVYLMLRVAMALGSEPLLISFWSRCAIIGLSIQPVWEGLADHRWNMKQLELLQQDYVAIDLIKHMELAMHGERCYLFWLTQQLLDKPGILGELESDRPYVRHLAPFFSKGWIYLNGFNADSFYEHYLQPCVNSRTGRIDPVCVALSETVAKSKREPSPFPFHLLEDVFSGFSDICRAGRSQSIAQCATSACALERYRLARGRYPDKLDELVPQYLAAVPRDVIDGQPLRYRREGADRFVLYSIGWNMKDDGGEVAWKKTYSASDTPRPDDKAGDWVWRSQPVKP